MSLLLAGVMAGASALSTMSANSADKKAAQIANYQELIDIERFKGDVALEKYNMSVELGSIESEQVAMAAAMGKRSSGGSVANIQAIGREDLAKNIKRMDREVERSVKMGQVSASARTSAAKSRATARNISTATTGLMTFSKALG